MMEWKDYLEEVRACAEDYLDNEAVGGDFREVFDAMVVDDSVTGNGSGSFTMDRAKAEENVEGILWDPDVADKFRELGYDGIPTEYGAESVDVIARCLALDDMYSELEEYYLAK